MRRIVSNMGTNAVQRDATAETVSANVKRLRKEKNLGLRGLSQKLGEVGRPLGHSAVDQIEKGTRRVDVDDLMALAAALNTSPATLLMPDTTREEWETAVDATGLPEGGTAQQLWEWLMAARSPHISADNAAEHFKWWIDVKPPGELAFALGGLGAPAVKRLKELDAKKLLDVFPELSAVDHGDD